MVLAEFYSLFFGENWKEKIQQYFWLTLSAALVFAIYRTWPKHKVEQAIKNSDVKIVVKVGNLLKEKNAIIVGSNTTFDTNITDGTISPKSVQGQLTEQLASNATRLDSLIESSLANVAPASTRTLESKPYGKLREYHPGTVAAIIIDERPVYLVAIATLNLHKAASSSPSMLLDSLPKMWESIRSRGTFSNISTPILGSGFSRVNLPRQTLLLELVKSFVAASREAKFTELLTIVISPEDFSNGTVSLSEVQKFLECQCSYPVQVGQSSPTGQAIV